MRFAFLVHPIASRLDALMQLDDDSGVIRRLIGVDLLRSIGLMHPAIQRAMQYADGASIRDVRVVDELTGLVSLNGAATEGRLYEIPMDAIAILEDPDQALAHIEQAVRMAADWGAQIVGLGSMTGIVGGRGTVVAEKSPIAITTGNSLTAYTALQNLFSAAEELSIDLADETVAVIGIPGSIASVAAKLLAPHCGKLLLVGRRASAPAERLAKQLDSPFLTDIPQALQESGLVLTTTSSGSCIDQSWLRPGTVVVDVGVPTDIRGNSAERDDVLILTGGLIHVPETMSLESKMLWFQRGMIPSCLGETMLLALEQRAECLSLGRELHPENVQEIGGIARSHGFDFSRLYSFGLPIADEAVVKFQQARHRMLRDARNHGEAKKATGGADPKRLGERAERLFGRYINPVLAAMNGTSGLLKTFVRGEGTSLFDGDGKRYLDFVGGFGSLNLGHNHPRVADAVEAAIRNAAPGFTPSGINPYATALAERLIELAPKGLEIAFLTNSGTESVEAALKLARAATGRAGLLSCDGSFHGKTLGSLSVTGNRTFQKPFEPLLGGCESVPYGDCEALERALGSRRFAAFIVEPIQAEGGMRVPPVGYLREAQSICRATGTLLIVDEVQTGLGRTGTLFAVEHEDVHPDVMTLAKSLGGGLMPIGAMLARRDVWLRAYGTVANCMLHSSTFGGGSLACAAGMTTLDVLVDERLWENAARRGEQLVAGLTRLCKRHRCLKQVRGRGLLLGIEFEPIGTAFRWFWHSCDPTGLAPFAGSEMSQLMDAFHVIQAMATLAQAHGIYTQFARSNPLVLRIEPPLTLSEAEADQFLLAFQNTCEEIDFISDLIAEMIAKTTIGKHDASERGANSGLVNPSEPNAVREMKR